MRRRHAGVLMVGWLLARPLAAHGQPTPDDAKALAERAARHMREVGAKQAIADFSNPAGSYVDRNLFVVTYDPQHKVVSSLGVPAYLGRDATRFRDDDGKEFGQEVIATAQARGAGWVDYRMTNPTSMKVEVKTSYVIKVDDYIVLVGAYRP